MKEYKAIVWTSDDKPGQRLTLMAESSDEAGRKLRAEYGEDAVFTCWNEDDARRPR